MQFITIEGRDGNRLDCVVTDLVENFWLVQYKRERSDTYKIMHKKGWAKDQNAFTVVKAEYERVKGLMGRCI